MAVQKEVISIEAQLDVRNALKSARNLAKELSSLGTEMPKDRLTLTSELQEAQTAALKLKNILASSTDSTTGALNISKFSKELKSSGMSLEQYRVQMNRLGPEGTAAFNKLAASVASAEKPLRETNKLMNSLMDSFANTVKWQISSSAIHGVMSAIQGAYRYAEDLNRSLNDIRIVTGQSTDQMARFAKEANNSAKALSTTTKQYTDASLIYYQQGLSDKEVKQRTDVTIKMANAAGESAKVVSDQLTAVWNNFYDGTKSLEYYADVMTALGAATASSTDEIAQGLEKFAAVSDTVGLSYEYATSALATVTATTRQSADVVGTAFKTIFARLEGLNLGDTLDDGTTLNKYSAALEKVGVNIKTANGDMKQMDQILDELGSRWDKLGQDQRVALAQTVAGTRQYTQLVALMDNWEYFQENLLTAQNSEGTLQEQADIYAESWEGAQKRVKASLESIYQDLINDKFFIKLQNRLADILGVVKDITTSIGGMKGLLPGILAIVIRMTASSGKISGFINTQVNNLSMRGKAGDKRINSQKEEALAAIRANSEEFSSSQGYDTKQFSSITEKEVEYTEKVSEIKNKLNKQSKEELAIFEKEEKARREIIDARQEEYYQNIKNLKVAKEEYAISKSEVNNEKRALQAESIASIFNKNTNTVVGKTALIKDIYNSTNYKQIQKFIPGSSVFADKSGFNKAEGYGFGSEDEVKAILKSFELSESEINNAMLSRTSFYEELLKDEEKLMALVNNPAYQNTDFVKRINGIDSSSMNNLSESVLKQYYISAKTEDNKKGIENRLDLLQSSRGRTRQSVQDSLVNLISENYEFKGLTSTGLNNLLRKTFSISDTDKTIATIFSSENIKSFIQANGGTFKSSSLTKEEKSFIDSLLKTTGLEQKVEESGSNYIKSLEEGETKLDKANKKYKDFGTTVTELAGGLSQVAFAWSSLASIDDVLTDDTLNSWEKMQQLILSLSMSLPALINGFKQAKKAIVESKTVDMFFGEGGGANEGFSSILNSLTGVVKKEGETEGDALLNALKGKEGPNDNFLLKQLRKGYEKQSAKKVAELTAKGGQAAMEGAAATGEGAIAAGGSAVAGAASALVPLIPYILAAAAAIAAVAAAVYLGIKAWNKDADALKEAQKRTKAVKEETLAAKQAYDDLKSGLANYQDAYNGLNKLVVGTQEFKEALLAANEQAMELITKYTDLQYVVDENGAIKIDEKSMDTVLNQQLNELNKKQIQLNATKMIENRAAIKNNETQFVREGGDAYDWGDALARIGEGAAAGFLAGGLSGMIAGASVGGAIAFDENLSVGSAEREAMSALAERYAAADEYEKAAMFGDQYESIIDELVGSNEILGNYLKENIETVKEEIKTNQALADQNAAMAKQNITNAYESIEAYQKSYIGEALASINASEYFSEEKIIEAAAKLDSQYSRKELAKMYGEEFYSDTYNKAVEGGIKFTELGAGNWQIQKYNTETGKWEDDQEVAVNSLLETYAAAVTQRELAQSEYNAKNNQWEALANKLEEQLLKVEGNAFKILDEDKDTYLTQEAQQKISDLIKDYGTNGQINLYAAGFTEADLAILKDVRTSNQEFNIALEEARKSYEEDKVKANYAANEEYAKKLKENQAKRRADIQQATGMSEDAIAIYAELNDLTESQTYHILELSAAMNKLKKSLTENSKPIADFIKAQNENTDISAASAVAIGEIRTNLKDLYGVSFSAEEISENLQLIQEAANGDAEAIENLSGIAAKKMVEDWDINPDLKIDETQLVTFKQQLIDLADDISGEGIQITPEVDIKKAIDSLRELVTAGQITSEQAESYLRRIGYEPVVQKEMVEQETKHDLYLGETKLFSITDKYNVEVPMITDASMVGHGITELPSSSDSSSSSGGGTSDTKPLKKIDELDPLADLENQLKSLRHEYELLDKVKDKTYGKGKTDLLKKEIENLKQQEEILKQESAVLAKSLELRAQDVAGLGFEINKDGYVINQDELYTKWLDEVEQARLSGNKDQYDEAKETYEEHVKDLENWNKAVEEIQQKNLETLDTYTQRLEAELEELTQSFEIKIEIDDRQLEYLEYLLNRLDDSGFDAAVRIKNYSQQIEVVTDKALQNREAIDAILNHWGLTIEQLNQMSEDELSKIIMNSDDIEKLQEYSSALMELDEQLRELKDTAGEELLTMIDKYNEDMDKLSSKLEHLTTMTESYQNIVDLVGKDRLSIDDSVLKDLRKAEQTIANEKTALYKRQKDDLQISEKELQEGLAQAQARLSEAQRQGLDANQLQSYKDDVKYWQDALEEIGNDIQETEEDLMSSLQAALQLAADDFKATIEEAIKEFEQTTLGSAGSMSQLKASMEQIKDEREWYLNDLEKMHDLSKIQRDLDKQMNSVQSQNARKQYLAFQEELGQLAMSGVKVSKQDVDYLTKKLKLTQARIALEESQNNKTMVRMTRNAEGGWGYVYTADADKTAEAQQAYEDALYELGKSGSEYAEEMAQRIVLITEKMAEDIQAVLEDADITDESIRQQRIAEIQEFYNRQIDMLQNELDKTVRRNQDFFDTDYSNFVASYDKKYGQQIILGEREFGLTEEQIKAIGGLRKADYRSVEEYLKAVADATGLSMGQVRDLSESGWLDAIASSEQAEEDITNSNSGITTSFNTTTAGMATGFKSYYEVTNSVAKAMGDPKTGTGLAGAVDKAYKSLEGDVNTALKAAGEDTVTFKNKLVEQAPLINKQTKSIGDEATKTSKKFTDKKTGLPAATDAVTGLQEAFSNGASKIGTIAPTYAEGISKITGGTSTLVDLLNILQNDIDYDKIVKGLNSVASASTPGGSGTGSQGVPYESSGGTSTTNSTQSISSRFRSTTKNNGAGKMGIVKTDTGKYLKVGATPFNTASLYGLGEDGNYYLYTNDGEKINNKGYAANKYVIGYDTPSQLFKGGYNLLKSKLALPWKTGRLEGIKFYDDSESILKEEDSFYLIHYDDGYYWIPKNYLIQNTSVKNNIQDYINKDFSFNIPTPIFPRNSSRLLPDKWTTNAKGIPQFDTGGYTGNWGKEGRLAVLHQKELVLNAKDTTNFLGASKILRSVSEKLNLKAAAQKNNGSEAVALASTSGDADRILRAIENMDNKMEQIVTITAQFPEARDHNEIEEAFNNLLNKTSQYINRKR